MPTHPTKKETDDVSGAAREAGPEPLARLDPPEGPEGDETPPGLSVEVPSEDEADPLEASEAGGRDPDALADPPASVAELAASCVRFVAARHGATLDFEPDTLSFVDQWLGEARAESKVRPEVAAVVQATAGAYLGEVVRRRFGGRWSTEGDYPDWRLYLSTVYCAFNPIGMAREALLLGTADGWHAHFEVDPAEQGAVEQRLDALPAVDSEEYYAPSSRFDVLWIVVDALRQAMRSRGLDGVRFAPEDYG